MTTVGQSSALVTYVLNVRADQIHPQRGAVRLPRINQSAVIKVYGEYALLFGSRDEEKPGYFGTARLGECIPDHTNVQFFWLRIFDQQLFDHPATLQELRALSQSNEVPPFYAYANAVRRISPDELRGLHTLGRVSTGFGETKSQDYEASGYRHTYDRIRRRAVRFQMLEIYGPNCVFTDNIFPTLDGLGSAVDVSHLQPLWLGGQDVIQNVMPMTKDVNHLWDSGIISLTNAGKVLVATNAPGDARSLVAGRAQVRFPNNPEFWPRAEFLERHRDEVFEKGRNGRGQDWNDY